LLAAGCLSSFNQLLIIPMRGELCVGFASILSLASLILLIFLHVGQINTSTVPRKISMVRVNMTAYGAAIQAATWDPVQGLYTNNGSAPLQAEAGVRQTYEFGLYSYCAFVQDGTGICGNHTIAEQFRPFDTITADMFGNYSVFFCFVYSRFNISRLKISWTAIHSCLLDVSSGDNLCRIDGPYRNIEKQPDIFCLFHICSFRERSSLDRSKSVDSNDKKIASHKYHPRRCHTSAIRHHPFRRARSIYCMGCICMPCRVCCPVRNQLLHVPRLILKQPRRSLYM